MGDSNLLDRLVIMVMVVIMVIMLLKLIINNLFMTIMNMIIKNDNYKMIVAILILTTV